MKNRFTKQETESMIAEKQHWCHQIEVGHGLSTSGGEGPTKLSYVDIPEDLTGLTVLDIGAADGFFSFICEERNAKSVLATDHPHWNGQYEYQSYTGIPRKDHFDAAHMMRGSSIKSQIISVYDLDPNILGKFDLVLFLGVLYHLMHPTVGLEHAVQMTEKHIIVESALHKNHNLNAENSLMIYAHKYVNDSTNWWYPNPECIRSMMLAFGCEQAEITAIAHSRIVVHGYKNGYKPVRSLITT